MMALPIPRRYTGSTLPNCTQRYTGSALPIMQACFRSALQNVQSILQGRYKNSLPSALLNDTTNWHLESRGSNLSLFWVAGDVEKS
jgi:hypothetical protein